MNQKRILVFGADGLRPDMITPEHMPHTTNLLRNGVMFSRFHATYPSATRISAGSFSTGSTPGAHGIVGYVMLVPGVNDDHVVNTEHYEHMDAMAAREEGTALLATPMSDLVRRAGGRVAVAGTGSNGHNAIWSYNDRGRIINPTSTFGIPDNYSLREKLGPIPKMAVPHYELNDYATRATTGIFLHDPNLTVIVLWITEPDGAMHWHGIGSEVCNAALKDVDDCLGRVLDTMDRLGIRDQFDILSTSDHGHSTVTTHKSLGDFLGEAKLDLGKAMPDLVTAADFAYTRPGVPEPSAADLEPLMEWLYSQPWVDLVLTGSDDLAGIPGTIPLRTVWNGKSNHRRPLFAVSPAWSEETNEQGYPGKIAALTSQAMLRTTHGTLCPYDIRATLIASGPSFIPGLVSETPSGLIVVAPTVLTILGLPVPPEMDGRVLTEALANQPAAPLETSEEIVRPATPRGRDRGVTIARVNSTTYARGSAFPVARV